MIETTDAILDRMIREKETTPNQLAVVGYLKILRIEKYLAQTIGNDIAFMAVVDVMREPREEVMRDINLGTLRAIWSFLIYDHNWTTEYESIEAQ